MLGSAGSKVQLLKQLTHMKYVDGTSIPTHLNQYQKALSQLKKLNIKFDDEVQALLLLGMLPESWETLSVSLSNSSPGGILTMSLVTNALLGEELRRGSSASSSKTEVLVTSE